MEWGKEEAAFHSSDLEVPSGLPGGDVPRMLVSGWNTDKAVCSRATE